MLFGRLVRLMSTGWPGQRRHTDCGMRYKLPMSLYEKHPHDWCVLYTKLESWNTNTVVFLRNFDTLTHIFNVLPKPLRVRCKQRWESEFDCILLCASPNFSVVKKYNQIMGNNKRNENESSSSRTIQQS